MRCLRRLGWAGAILAGCQSSPKAPYADNPLLMSREPLKQPAAAASKPASGSTVSKSIPVVPPPTTVSRVNAAQGPRTTPPSPPAANKPAAEPTPTTAEAVKAQNKPTAKPAIAAASATAPSTPIRPVLPKTIDATELTPPVSALTPAGPVSPITPVAAVRTAPKNDAPATRFAHAPDYSWLVGEVDVHYRGHKELRFCSLSDENAIGGKVRLVDQPQLADLKPGARIRIEGELVRDDLAASNGEYPRYHIRSVQVLDPPTK